MQVVWFKRDLRVQDNRALARASECGPVLPIYIVEPDLWQQPDMSGRHWAFVMECLHGLKQDLQACGSSLVVRTGQATSVFEALHQQGLITALWSHEETGNGWSYRRDQDVAAWCRAQGLIWHELRNHGVQRRLKSRDGWARNWDAFMAEAVTGPPTLAPHNQDAGALPSAHDLGLKADPCPERQEGGRRAAEACLQSFLTQRGQSYRKAMSSPLAGESACSRLSPHLAWGTMSMREAAQATWARQRALKQQQPQKRDGWRGAMSSFSGRLHWHCHFIQKLEDEPRIEFENLHPSYDGLRVLGSDQARLTAWENGETGLPFVDACMRYLRATGWLNFRMRAMVMSVASYQLWLHWRDPGLVLSRLFTDYEPGIHWSQVQMQSGTTGINTIRIYNPVKQGYDQDPKGLFTRRWVPELAKIPDAVLHEPWKAENAGSVLGKLYPEPIVDHLAAARDAREKIWAVRKGAAFHKQADKIQARHGSRKSGIPIRGERPMSSDVKQLKLPFGGEAL